MDKTRSDFLSLVRLAFDKGAIKKIIFSRPITNIAEKISGRLCQNRGKRILALEFSLKDNTVSQKNLTEQNLDEIAEFVNSYLQINLLTTHGDAEYKARRDGNAIILGGDKLKRKLESDIIKIERALDELDRKKHYLLQGNEDFLYQLGISSKDGRVHDKKQGKFRQINRFLAHIDNLCPKFQGKEELVIYDLCSGKSYLSFAVYYFLTAMKGFKVNMLCVDLKKHVMDECAHIAKMSGFDGMHFMCDDITNLRPLAIPDMVISLHACDVATDIVINTAIRFGAKIILSTPCCHRYLKGRLRSEELSFVTRFGHLEGKLCEVLTDAMRVLRLEQSGYRVSAVELTDPENTPKNTLIRAVRDDDMSLDDKLLARERLLAARTMLLGEYEKEYPDI